MFVMLSKEVHNKMHMLPSEKTLLWSCEEVWQLNFKVSLTRIAQSQLGAWLKNKGDNGLWSLSAANLSSIAGSEQTKVVVPATDMGDICC